MEQPDSGGRGRGTWSQSGHPWLPTPSGPSFGLFSLRSLNGDSALEPDHRDKQHLLVLREQVASSFGGQQLVEGTMDRAGRVQGQVPSSGLEEA